MLISSILWVRTTIPSGNRGNIGNAGNSGNTDNTGMCICVCVCVCVCVNTLTCIYRCLVNDKVILK